MPRQAAAVSLDSSLKGDRFIGQHFRRSAQRLSRVHAHSLNLLVVSHACLALRNAATET
jgi:hypothetical protein